MKTLKRLVFSAMLLGLAGLSTAVAGSAYGGIATARGSAMMSEALAPERPERIYICRVRGDRVEGCEPAEPLASP